MTNTEGAFRTLVTTLLALSFLLGWVTETVVVLAPPEETTTVQWECLRGLGLVGNPTDQMAAFYPTRLQLMNCS